MMVNMTTSYDAKEQVLLEEAAVIHIFLHITKPNSIAIRHLVFLLANHTNLGYPQQTDNNAFKEPS